MCVWRERKRQIISNLSLCATQITSIPLSLSPPVPVTRSRIQHSSLIPISTLPNDAHLLTDLLCLDQGQFSHFLVSKGAVPYRKRDGQSDGHKDTSKWRRQCLGIGPAPGTRHLLYQIKSSNCQTIVTFWYSLFLPVPSAPQGPPAPSD